jgi:AcrR family transcriptional regulator
LSSAGDFFLDPPPARLPKRERTRQRLMRAALGVLARRGVAATTAQEVAAAAEVANGTFYNYFPTREALFEALSLWLTDSLCRHISASYDHIKDGAERMAIGNRRYVLFALDSPDWTRLVLGLVDAGTPVIEHVWPYARVDLLLGVRQGRFRPVNERAAADLINGTVLQAMRRVHGGGAGRSHAIATATTVLRGLGMDFDEAPEVARRPLPPLSVDLPQLPPRSA